MGCMAKVKINGITNVKNNIKKLFDEVRKDPSLLLEIGNKTVELTVNFNRAGSSPAANLGAKKHPKNSDAWENRKEKLTATNPPSEHYRKGLSNVTFTGDLLESIDVTKINTSNGTVEINATGNHKPYRNLDGSKAGKSIPNSTLVGYLKEKRRFIFGINKQITNNINRIVRRFLNKRIKQFNK